MLQASQEDRLRLVKDIKNLVLLINKIADDQVDDTLSLQQNFTSSKLKRYIELVWMECLKFNAVYVYQGRRSKWRLKFGSFHKGLKEVPAGNVRECVENCQFSLKCFVASWTEDNKCHVQQDGDGELNPGNLETRPNALTFLGRKKQLLRYRKGGLKSNSLNLFHKYNDINI